MCGGFNAHTPANLSAQLGVWCTFMCYITLTLCNVVLLRLCPSRAALLYRRGSHVFTVVMDFVLPMFILMDHHFMPLVAGPGVVLTTPVPTSPAQQVQWTYRMTIPPA